MLCQRDKHRDGVAAASSTLDHNGEMEHVIRVTHRHDGIDGSDSLSGIVILSDSQAPMKCVRIFLNKKTLNRRQMHDFPVFSAIKCFDDIEFKALLFVL